MKSKKLSAYAISLKIAEHLEPRAGVTLTRSRNDFCGELPSWIDAEEADYYVSPRRCWIVIYKGGGGCELAPRDMTKDAAMILLMVNRPNFVGLNQLEKDEWEASFCKSTKHSVDCSEYANVIDRVPERAIARAFLDAHHL